MDAERETRRTALLDECFQQKSRLACVCVCVCVCVSWMQNETLGGLHCWMSVSNEILGGRVCLRMCVCVLVCVCDMDAERETWRTALLDECLQQKSRLACMCACVCVCVRA